MILERDESLCEKYDVHVRSVKRTTNIPGLHVVLMWIMLIIELAKKYGVRAATINIWKKEADAQWSIWHEYCEQNIDCSDGFESMCEPICICCECGIILFPCDVKWVDSRKKTSPPVKSFLMILSHYQIVLRM